MLHKNGERYTLSLADNKLVAKYFPKFPAKLTYTKAKIKHNKKNPKPDKPNSISTPFYVSKKTKSGTETWRYFDHEQQLENGVKKYTPTHMHLTGSQVITENDKELAFWLINASPFLQGGENYNSNKVAKYAIENLISDADIRAAKKEEEAEINALIYSKIGLPEEKLRLIASAMFIDGVEEMTLSMVRLAVEHEISRDKLDGVRKFRELSNAEQVLTVRSNIQRAIDANIIKYNKPTKEWQWVMGQGKKNELITKINPKVQENEALYTYYSGDANFAELLLTALNVVADPE